MLNFSILFILSNAVTLRRDKSILFSRVTIIVLLYSSLIAFNSLYFSCLESGIVLYLYPLNSKLTLPWLLFFFFFYLNINIYFYIYFISASLFFCEAEKTQKKKEKKKKLCHTTKKLRFIIYFVLSSSLTRTIFILTLIIVLFILTPQE